MRLPQKVKSFAMYRVDPGNSWFVPEETIPPPLKQIWRVTLPSIMPAPSKRPRRNLSVPLVFGSSFVYGN